MRNNNIVPGSDDGGNVPKRSYNMGNKSAFAGVDTLELLNVDFHFRDSDMNTADELDDAIGFDEIEELDSIAGAAGSEYDRGRETFADNDIFADFDAFDDMSDEPLLKEVS